jgi:hypothetical protein
MNEPLTWEALRLEARALEISVAERDGHVFLSQCGSGQYVKFRVNLAGCQAAAAWLADIRCAMEVRDHLRSLDLPRRRRMLLRYLWRR